MSRLRHTARALASGYAAMGVNVFYTLASVPLALHYLSKEEFSLWALVTQFAGYLLLIDLGMSASVSRILIDHKDDKQNSTYGTVIQTGTLVLLVQGACIALGGYLISFWVPGLYGVPAVFAHDFQLLVAGQCVLLGAFFVSRISTQILQAHQRFDILNYSQILQLSLGFAVQWLTFHRGWGLYSLLAASGVSLLCGAMSNGVSAVGLRLMPSRQHWGRPSYSRFKEIFAFGNEMFMLTLGLQLLNASQGFIITRTQGLAANATWTVATKIFTLAQQVVARIFDFSGSALGEMIVRGERDTLRRRFRDVLVITGAFAIFTGLSVAVCNARFLAVWTKGEFSWPWLNDALMGTLLVLNCVARCFIGLAGYAKQVRTMRWIYFLEGASFFIVALLVAPRFGMAGIIGVAILANLAWSGAYGFRWGGRYLGVSAREVAFVWLRPAMEYLLVMIPVAVLGWWITTKLPPLAGLLTASCVLAVIGLGLLWRVGLTDELRAVLRAGIARLRGR